MSDGAGHAEPGADAGPGPDRRAVAAVLFVGTFLLYAPAIGHPFTVYDDGEYVVSNPRVRGGPTAENLHWAFTTGHMVNWHPLTWVSLQFDAAVCDRGGSGRVVGPGVALDAAAADARAAAWGYHLTNVALHAANAALLFGVLAAATGATWRSAAAAALWAAHPQRVESVVWVTERKDVLSTFFWFLATAAYLRYARRPSVGRYLPVAAGMAAGLMAKPMVVTFPFALLLLDVWPLRRLGDPGAVSGGLLRGRVPPGAGRLVLEKVPLLAVVAVMVWITLKVQAQTVGGLEAFSLEHRAANAVVGYAAYLGQAVWPAGLVPFYPYTYRELTDPLVLGCAGGLVAVTLAAVVLGRRFPYLPVGWFWYLGTLVPVIGLVQVGTQARADRYTYVPMIGLTVAAVWAAAALAGWWGVGRTGRRAGLAAGVLVLGALTWRQVGRWADDAALWRYTVEVTGGRSPVVLNNVGVALAAAGRPADAVPYFRAAVALVPDDPHSRFFLAQAMFDLGREDDALSELETAFRLAPNNTRYRRNLGVLLARAGRPEEAYPHLLATADDPRPERDARLVLGRELLSRGFPAAAAGQLEHLAAADPGDPGVWLLLGTAQSLAGRFGPAEVSLREAARLQPNNPVALARLGLVVLRRGDHAEAVRVCRTGVAAAPGAPNPRIDLALALRAAGDVPGSDAEYAAAGRIHPGWADEYARAAWDAATTGRPGTSAYLAVCQARQACEATGYGNPMYVAALAAALAADGDFAEAATQVVAARGLAEKAGNVGMVRDLDGHLARYKAGKSLRDPP